GGGTVATAGAVVTATAAAGAAASVVSLGSVSGDTVSMTTGTAGGGEVTITDSVVGGDVSGGLSSAPPRFANPWKYTRAASAIATSPPIAMVLPLGLAGPSLVPHHLQPPTERG
ncbi:MAG: hypothetical protein H7066_06840, partial [Cytophagaceae bacterium]|nr:hypothetical protein [Gemmatimonadaceae bacterium]